MNMADDEIQAIDAIARLVGRDVLFISFEKVIQEGHRITLQALERDDWRSLPQRRQLVDWLEANDIPWKSCRSFSESGDDGTYRGQIYVDIHRDDSDPRLALLKRFLSHSDGTMRMPGTALCYTTYEQAVATSRDADPDFLDDAQWF
ncbi:conserved protein of unknown function [Pararobbsia alpina]|uniref:hypothetical protein n=1 Tax=Pararobbsia alpina TaxID=621374 RepID=UPI0039A49BF8